MIMNQGKPVNFSVIKQKIIKTDEVLRMYLETNNKLKSVQETCKGIKLKYDQTARNLNRIQLENERCTFNLENVTLKCELLEKENEKLREQKLTLEDKYNQQTIQSQLNIKELEDQLRMVQEMKMAAQGLSPKKKKKSSINENGKKIEVLEDKIKQLKESEVNSKNEVILLTQQNKKLSNDIIIIEKKHADTVRKFQDESSNLLEELNKLKSQINTANSNLKKKGKHETSLENLTKEKDREISELQKKIFTLIKDENRLKIIEEENEMFKKKIMDWEINLVNAKKKICSKDVCSQTDGLSKKHTRSIRIQTQESMKTLPEQDLISTENRKLKQTILDCDAEIFKLKARSKIATKHCHTQTEVLESDVESVEDILIEMRMPFSMLSPMRSCENLNFDNILSPMPEDIKDSHSALIDIPDIVITPPTPIIETNFEKLTDLHKTSVAPTNEHSSIERLDITNADNLKNSQELENREIKDNFKKIPRRRKYQSSYIGNDFVKLRKSCLKRMLNKRCVSKKEMRKVRKLSKQDCILKALRTLKHSNINFTISNESNIPKWWTDYNNYYESFKYPDLLSDINQQKENTIRTSISKQKYKNTRYITEKLKCNFKNCNNGNSCMLLNSVQGITELLGFFSVKNENITPSSSRMSNIVDNKNLNGIKSLNSPTSGSEITPENLLETLADLVSEKLREKRNFSKRRQKTASAKSDSFHSETETEIERLFATPDHSVLTRNKMLLKQAKQENLQESLFNSSLEENVSGSKYAVTDDEILQLELNHNSTETQGSKTEINSSGLDVASQIENKNTFHITEMNLANEFSFKSSTYTSNTNKTMVKPPLDKTVEKKPSELPEPIFNESADSCDSFQYSECPEIISPLNSVYNSPRSKGNHRILESDEKWQKESEQIQIEMPPSSPKNFKFSQQNKPDVLNASQNSSTSLMMSPVSSTYINKYICNEKIMSEQISTFISNFEEHNGSIEEPPSTPISHRKLLPSTNMPKRNVWRDIFKTEQNVENSVQDVDQNIIKNQSDISLTIVKSSLKRGQKILPNFSDEGANNSITTESNHVAHLSSPSDISTAQFTKEYRNVQHNNSAQKELMDCKQSEQNISVNDSIFPVQHELSSSPIENISEVLSVLSDAENTLNSISDLDEIKEITSCPQSPVNDFEEQMDIKIPKIIPLERVFEQDTVIGLSINSIENIPSSYDYPKQEDTMTASEIKIRSFSNEQLEKVISDELPKKENTSNHLPKISKTENIASYSTSPIHVICLPSPIDMSAAQFLKEHGKFQCNNTNSKNFMEYKQFDHNILLDDSVFPVNHELSNSPTINVTREILDALPDAEHTLNGISQINEIEDITNCPQSPVSDCEKYVDIKIPKIIPLERQFEQDSVISVESNSAENMLSPHEFLKEKETVKASKTKVESFINDRNEQLQKVILDALPKEENTPNNISKTNKIDNIASHPVSSIHVTRLPSPDISKESGKFQFRNADLTDLRGYKRYEHNISSNDSASSVNCELLSSPTMNKTREILDVLPDAENTSSGISKLNEIDDITCCPQLPVNDYEEIPKTIPLERPFEREATTGLGAHSTENMPSHELLNKENPTIKASETMIRTFNNAYNEQLKKVILDALSKRVINTPGHPSKPNEIANIVSYPTSRAKEKLIVMPLKVMPLEELDENDITDDFDKGNSAGDTSIRLKPPELNDECDKHILSINNNQKCDSENIALDCTNNEEQTTKCLKTIAASASPLILRRSKRICKKISYSKLCSQNDSESCATDSNSERSKSEDVSSNCSGEFSNSSTISEISMPIKRKRGKPKKYSLVKEAKALSVANMNSIEEVPHLKNLCLEKNLENTVLFIEGKILTKDINRDSRNSSQEENSIENVCVDPGRENIESDMFVDKVNSELKPESTSDDISNEHGVTNLWEKHEPYYKLVIDHTYAKVKTAINNVAREKQDEAVVRKEKCLTDLKSPDTVLSDMASRGNRTTNFWGTNEFHSDLIINETNCGEINDKIDEKEEIDETNSKEICDKSNDDREDVDETDSKGIEGKSNNETGEMHETEKDDKSNDEKEEMDEANTKEVNGNKSNDEKEKEVETNSKKIDDKSNDDKEDINETNSEEIDDGSNDEKEDINESNSDESNDELVVRKSAKTHLFPEVHIFRKISDIISDKRRIDLSERNVQHSDALISGTVIEKSSDKNKEAQEKIASKNSVRKRKPISTLKSNIIKQFRIQRKMFQMDVESVKKSNACDVKTNPRLNKNNVKKTNINVVSNSKSNMTQGTSILKSTNVYNKGNSCDDRKIHIVQNILIPANSCYTVDLMEKNRNAYSPFSSNCDISLDVTQTSSRSDVRPCNPSPRKKKNVESTNDTDIPIKRKRIEPVQSRDITNENSDILSQILGEMDKDRPNISIQPVASPSIPQQAILTNIEDNEWRKGIMIIAESMYNVANERDGFKQSTMLCNRPKNRKPSTKVRILMSRLSKLSTEDNIPDEIIVEFKRQTVDNIAEIILQRVSQDTTDKPDIKYYPAPLMTKTQRILLGLMVTLEKENIPNVLNTFLSKAEALLFATGCGIRALIPITRLYLAVCRLQADINKMRNFCCDAFYYMGNLAIPLLFTVLTSWIEVLPKEPDLKYYPLAKVLVQIVHLKGCNIPGYNLLPLRHLLHQYHEYPKERWDCNELFEELYREYIRNPVKSTALRLLCKHKEMKWTYRKVNEYLKPLVHKIPEEKVNYKATVIVLIGDMCSQYKPKNESDAASLRDLQWWLNSLLEREESCLIDQSVNYSLKKLRKKRKGAYKKIAGKIKNKQEVEEKVNEMIQF